MCLRTYFMTYSISFPRYPFITCPQQHLFILVYFIVRYHCISRALVLNNLFMVLFFLVWHWLFLCQSSYCVFFLTCPILYFYFSPNFTPLSEYGAFSWFLIRLKFLKTRITSSLIYLHKLHMNNIYTFTINELVST